MLEQNGEQFLETYRLPHLTWEEAGSFKQEHETEQQALEQKKRGTPFPITLTI